MNRISIRGFSHLVLGYMVLAFCWWAWLLWRQNDHIFELEKQGLIRHYGRQNQALNLTELFQTREYRQLEQERTRQRRMIVSEGLFFTLCLAFGLWIINSSTNKEVKLTRQRRNFLLSITHELKSPIASMRLIFDTLRKRELQKDQVRQLSENGLKDTDRLQKLVENLLLAARLEDEWRPHREPVDVQALVTECVEHLALRYPARVIQTNIPPDIPPLVTDKAGITSALLNLLENALKYSSEPEPVLVSVKYSNSGWEIAVADFGIGIPDAEKKSVFEKFYRVGSEETRQTSGTGLGLYIVKQVVAVQGGSITVTDNTPKGAVFTIHL